MNKNTYNDLPKGHEGDQKRRTEFESSDKKLEFDSKGLIEQARRIYHRGIVTVQEVLDLRKRFGDHSVVRINADQIEIPWKKAIACELANEVSQEAQEPIKPKEKLGKEAIEQVQSLFNSPEYGYEGYALETLRAGGIDPDQLRKDDDPFFVSPQEALDVLLNNLTPDQWEVIQKVYSEPAILVRPIVTTNRILKNIEGGRIHVGDMNLEIYGNGWKFMAHLGDVAEMKKRKACDPAEKIYGWRIGIGDIAEEINFLATDGDVRNKSLQERAHDFRGVYGSMGFETLVDDPMLYSLVVAANREKDGFLYEKSRSGSREIDGEIVIGSSNNATIILLQPQFECATTDPQAQTQFSLILMFKKP